MKTYKKKKKKEKGLHQKLKSFFPEIRNKVKTKEKVQRLSCAKMGTVVKLLGGGGGGTDADHSQIIGRDAVKLLGRIYPPRVSEPLAKAPVLKW